jgi:uncharacterized protein (DUF927 family)
MKFRVNDDGVFVLKGETSKKLAARVDILAEGRDGAGCNWSRLLRWCDRDGLEHRWLMPMGLLDGDPAGVRQRLVSEGVFLERDRSSREDFIEYLQTWPVNRLVRSVQRTGWCRNNYILPDRVLGEDHDEEIIFQPPQGAQRLFGVSGTVDTWRDKIGRLCAGNSRLVFATSAALTGPLLTPLGAESGGFHFYGLSSTGKSTALSVAASVCGPQVLVRSWRATANGLEAIAALHNDTTLFIDELGQANPNEAEQLIYMLANGIGKGRMNERLELVQTATWKILTLSTGELTLAGHVATIEKKLRGGAEVRLANIDADAGAGMGLFEDLHGIEKPDAFADQLKALARKHYGGPFLAFLQKLIADTSWKRDVLDAQSQFAEVYVPVDAGGEVKRAGMRFGLIGAAGELATRYGVFGWDDGEALWAAGTCFESWLANRGTIGSSDMENALNQVRGFIEVNGSSRFQNLDAPGDNRPIHNRAGFKRSRGANGEIEYLILRQVFQEEVCRAFEYRKVSRALNERGLLRREGDGRNMTIKTRLPELGNVRVYCIRGAILDDDESTRIRQKDSRWEQVRSVGANLT